MKVKLKGDSSYTPEDYENGKLRDKRQTKLEDFDKKNGKPNRN